ncbi:biosynthesis protein [Aspergillus sp. HF37]|nr:biosynthesis protein [Aspergillus sp. HF37]
MTSTPPSPFLSSSATSQAPPAKKPPAPPVPLLPTQAAKTYALAHPLLLLSLLALRFERLVADPMAELLNSLPLLTVLQAGYVTVCLPAAGGGSPGTGSRGVGYRRKLHGQGAAGAGAIFARLIPALLSLTLAFLLGTPAVTLLLILFGAPATTNILETILCGVHMAVLAVTGLVYAHGVDGHVWSEIWGAAHAADGVWGGALGTGVGAWLGAVPIPLDWDRPWQAYPVTIVAGAYLGFAVGSVVGRSRWVYGKRIEFSAEELGVEKKDD